jgi:pyruvyl transferase EpsO
MRTIDLMVSLRSKAEACHSRLLAGVDRVLFVEVPDHVNVGDSAIFLGILEFFRRQGIAVTGASSVHTAGPGVFSSKIPVVIQGGGNFGGLYPPYEEFRMKLATDLPPDTLLIQAPQSVHFADESNRRRFEQSFARRPNTRLAVRDRASMELTTTMTHVSLSPDGAQVLGPIEAPGPVRERVVLARRDLESASASAVPDAVDWPEGESLADTIKGLFRLYQHRALPFLPVFANPSPDGWEAIARRRLQRGLAVLALGETVVTDRLHAMILARLLGRRVIAIDNSTGKLSAYARTWYPDLDSDDFVLAGNFDEALARV